MSKIDSMSALLALREATRAAHERLHDVPVFAALAAGTIARDAYVSLLCRLFGFHAPMEAALAGALEGNPYGIDAQAWQRAHLIRADLAELGMEDAATAALPTLRQPDGLTQAEAMGCLYVVEGSTLGGRQLARRLDHVLPQDSQAGRRFLLASAQPGHVRWATICAALNACGLEEGRRADMTAGAIRTFAQFEAWFGDTVSAA